MIEAILPETVIAVESRVDAPDGVLLPGERALIKNAVAERRREFTTVRACARQALDRLELPPVAVMSGKFGEPLWPFGVVGSMTHCEGYRGCAVASSSVVATIGIDATPHNALQDDLVAAIARPEERAWLEARARVAPGVHWERLLFSAKESAYKAWFPLGRQRLSFEHATVCFNAREQTFMANMLVPAPRLDGGLLAVFLGRWLIADGLVLTAIAVPRRPHS